MKEVIIDPQPLGKLTLPEAFDFLFSTEKLKNFHGKNTYISPWKDDKRTIRFQMDVDAVPQEVRVFFCGEKLRITTTQNVEREKTRWTVSNRVRLHFVGAELFDVRPTFCLETDKNDITNLSCKVQHRARLPIPLNGIVERFMASQTLRELNEYKEIISDDLTRL